MANGRNVGRRVDAGREPGRFVALPDSVLDCAAYVRLSYPARALLLEVARQFVGDNNGRLLASRRFLAERGWNSADVIHRAKHELLDAGFIFETVKGHRPNKAGWFAVTWRSLDRHPGYDAGVEKAFRRGAYRGEQNALLSPPGGSRLYATAPPGGPSGCVAGPCRGPVNRVQAPGLVR